MAGIVANVPSALASLFELGRTGALSPFFIVAFLFIAAGVIMFIVFIERAQRRVVIQYPKRQVGNRMFGGDSTHMPLKINTSGVIPPIFASSILLIPAPRSRALSGAAGETGILSTIGAAMAHGTPLYMLTYAAMIVFFSYFYTAVVFNPEETADNLKKNGGFIPGIRPGTATATYFDTILTRLTHHRRGLSVHRLPAARSAHQPVRRAVLFRRNQRDDHRVGHHGHGDADPVAPDRPPV